MRAPHSWPNPPKGSHLQMPSHWELAFKIWMEGWRGTSGRCRFCSLQHLLPPSPPEVEDRVWPKSGALTAQPLDMLSHFKKIFWLRKFQCLQLASALANCPSVLFSFHILCILSHTPGGCAVNTVFYLQESWALLFVVLSSHSRGYAVLTSSPWNPCHPALDRML